MPSHPGPPIVADDQVIRRATEHVDVALLAALAYVTGDLSLLGEDLRPDLSNPFDPDGGWTPDQRASARQLAFETIVGLRDGKLGPPSPRTEDELRRIMAFAGAAVTDEHLGLLQEELAVEDLRAPGWTHDGLAPDREFSVAVIGAGMSGLATAVRLDQAGIDYVVLEKDGDVGGTWFENTYPGCRVDIPNHLYSYTFAQKDDWSEHYSTQPVLLDYFRECADRFGIRPHIRFGTEVAAATFSEERCRWTLRLHTPRGDEELEVDAVVVAVGQLNRPKLPDIPGADSFAGPSFHSARWDHGVDLAGRRVAVIGSAASAVQLCPVVAEEAAELHIFQRTPNWFVPVPIYHDEVAEGLRWSLTHVPSYGRWYRFCLFTRLSEGLEAAAVVDPEWQPQDRSVGLVNDFLRAVLTAYLEGEFADRPDLLARVLPAYPPASKRMLLDNGIWARTLKRDNVDLVTVPIEGITPSGIVTSDGAEHDVDVIIYATGFEASRFLTPMQVTGRGGVDLHEHWDGDARAYLGMMVPGFPNLFCLYGPNTNIVVNGSIIFFSECAVSYVMGCLRLLLEGDHAALDIREDVHAAFNRRVDEANRLRVWGVSGVNSWYKNERGRVSQNWPFPLIDYWQRTRVPDVAEFEVLDRATPAGVGGAVDGAG